MELIYIRYSEALLSLANDENKINEYKNAITEIFEFINANKSIDNFLKSYFVKDEDKYALLDEICKSYNLKSLPSFMKLLVKKHHYHAFKYLVSEFKKEANKILGIYEGIVYSTSTLDKEQISNIEASISKKLNSKIELKNKIDTKLLGGVKVIVHDHVYDGSLAHKIDIMKQKLNEGMTTK